MVTMAPSDRPGYLTWVSTTAPHPRLNGFISRFDGETVLGLDGQATHGMSPEQVRWGASMDQTLRPCLTFSPPPPPPHTHGTGALLCYGWTRLDLP